MAQLSFDDYHAELDIPDNVVDIFDYQVDKEAGHLLRFAECAGRAMVNDLSDSQRRDLLVKLAVPHIWEMAEELQEWLSENRDIHWKFEQAFSFVAERLAS